MWPALLARRLPGVTRVQTLLQAARLDYYRTESSESQPEKDHKFMPNLQELILSQQIVDWEKIRNEFPKLLTNQHYPYRGSFAGAVFMTLNSPENLNHLRQFVNYTGMANLPPTLLAKYMSCSDDPDEILQCWDLLSEKRKQLPHEMLYRVVTGLLRTPQWRQALELSEETTIFQRGKGVFTLHLIIQKLFELGLDDEAFFHWERKRPPIQLGSYVNPCLNDFNRTKRILKFVTQHELSLNKSIDIFGNEAWHKHFDITEVKIGTSSRCPACRTVLPPGKLSEDQFAKMRDAFMKVVLKTDDIYLNSTPSELISFNQFIQSRKPFHVIVDGLNLFYKEIKFMDRIMTLCREYERIGCSRILIVLKTHVARMLKGQDKPWSKTNFQVEFYTVQNLSKDDPFIILGALRSGVDCRLFSSDLFRDHSFKFNGDEESNFKNSVVFQKWLFSRRDAFEEIDGTPLRSKSRSSEMLFAPKHFSIPYEDPKGWHLPSKFKDKHWICLRHPKRREGKT